MATMATCHHRGTGCIDWSRQVRALDKQAVAVEAGAGAQPRLPALGTQQRAGRLDEPFAVAQTALLALGLGQFGSLFWPPRPSFQRGPARRGACGALPAPQVRSSGAQARADLSQEHPAVPALRLLADGQDPLVGAPEVAGWEPAVGHLGGPGRGGAVIWQRASDGQREQQPALELARLNVPGPSPWSSFPGP
jgi:hypothetical protein